MEKELTQEEKINLWLEALESGEYKQGVGLLSFEGEYCCLGVLCEVAMKNGLGLEVETHANNEKWYDGEAGVLPEIAKEWIGMKSNSGNYGKDKELTADNDNGKTFKQIARIIRKNKKSLFNLNSAK